MHSSGNSTQDQIDLWMSTAKMSDHSATQRNKTAEWANAALNRQNATNVLPVSFMELGEIWHRGAISASSQFVDHRNDPLEYKKMLAFFWVTDEGQIDPSIFSRKIKVDDSMQVGVRWMASMIFETHTDGRPLLRWQVKFAPWLSKSDLATVLVHELDHVGYYYAILRRFGNAFILDNRALHDFKTEFFARYHTANFLMLHQNALGLDWNTLFAWTGSEHDPKNGEYERAASLASRAISARNAIYNAIQKKYRPNSQGIENPEMRFYFEAIVHEIGAFFLAIFHTDALEKFVEHLENATVHSRVEDIFASLASPRSSHPLLVNNSFFQHFQQKVAGLRP